MKKNYLIFYLVVFVFSFGCSREDGIDNVRKKINTPENQEILQSRFNDTINVQSPRTPNDVGHDVVNLFDHQKTSDQDSVLIDLSVLRAKLLQIEDMPDICKTVIIEVLNTNNMKFASPSKLDSAKVKIIECVFFELLEK